MKFKIQVPATSANIGPGFDSMGIALSLYNYVTAEETDDGLKIDILDETSRFLHTDERNLIYRSMARVFKEVGYKAHGIHLTLENNIPVTRGLGSSSAGIVGGLLAGNAISGNKLSQNDILRIAAELEGHPDNVTPALLGGFTVNILNKSDVKFVKTEIKDDLKFAALIPSFYLQTKKSRGILPEAVSHRDAVFNTGRSALLTASLISGKYENIRTAVGDKLHQRYRKRLIPYMDELFNLCYANGALGVYLSGAGPTIIAIIKSDNLGFCESIRPTIDKKMSNWSISLLSADNKGATVEEI